MTFKPFSNRVLVKVQKKVTTQSGIYVPSNDMQSVQKGEVVAVGDGAVTMQGDIIPMEVIVGDTVMFAKQAGVEIEVDGESFLLFHETDLMGAIR